MYIVENTNDFSNYNYSDTENENMKLARKEFAQECLSFILHEKEKGYNQKDILDDIEDFLTKETNS